MNETLDNLLELVTADLRRGVRLIIRIQDELDPQVRIATPDGDFHIAMTLPDDPEGVVAMFDALATFLAFRQSLGFTLISEIKEPNALYTVGTLRGEWVAVLMEKSESKPFTEQSFGAIASLPSESVDDSLRRLLPDGLRTVSQIELEQCEALFGQHGSFPAVHIPSGEVRGLA